MSDEFVHDGSLLGMAEMIRAGITCVNDMRFFPRRPPARRFGPACA